MNIFINTISNDAIIILFDNSRQIVDKLIFNIKGNESSLLIPKIDEILVKNKLDYFQLDNIVVVNGPGSFTGVRTTILAANSINYIVKKSMTDLSYFDLYKNYPIIKSSSKRDCFIQLNKNENIQIILNDNINVLLKEKNIKKAYGNAEFIEIEIVDNIDYVSIINELELTNKSKVEALYIKKPNIC